MAMNKRGIFFTFISILIVILLVATLSPKSDLRPNFEGQKTRIDKINQFISNFKEDYMEDVIISVTHRALTSLTYYMDNQNEFISDLGKDFNTVALNGTIDGNEIDQYTETIAGKKIMFNNTLSNWTNRLVKIGEETLNIELNVSLSNISIYQTTPWIIRIELLFSYYLKSETVNWQAEDEVISTTLEISTLYDPLFYVNSDGNYNITPIKTKIKFDEWNNTNMRYFIGNGTYFHWQDSTAPNFLMRFVNNTNASPCCGIESAVNPNHISVGDRNASYIDYLYWNHTFISQCDKLYDAQTEVWDDYQYFRLDFNNIIKYNISGYIQQTCS